MLSGFEKLSEDETLEDYGFPPSVMWIKKVDKLQPEESLNTDSLVAEFKQGRYHTDSRFYFSL